YRARALMCQGRLKQAERILQQSLESRSGESLPVQSWIPADSVVCATFADLLCEWNRLEEAGYYVTQALELGQRLAFGSTLWAAYDTLARIRLARDDSAGARI